MKRFNKKTNSSLFQVLFFMAIILSSQIANAQGKISGYVSEKATGEPILFAAIALFKEGVLITRSDTDLKGDFLIDGLSEGIYDVEISELGFSTIKVVNIELGENEQKNIHSKMIEEEVVYSLNHVPLFSAPIKAINETTSDQTIVFQNKQN